MPQDVAQQSDLCFAVPATLKGGTEMCIRDSILGRRGIKDPNEGLVEPKYRTVVNIIFGGSRAVSYTHLDVYKRQLYNTLWEQAGQYAVENLKDDELSYYYEVTD